MDFRKNQYAGSPPSWQYHTALELEENAQYHRAKIDRLVEERRILLDDMDHAYPLTADKKDRLIELTSSISGLNRFIGKIWLDYYEVYQE